MVHFLSTTVLALLYVWVLSAASPPNPEGRVEAGTSPTITDTVNAPQDQDEEQGSIVVLPGTPPQAAVRAAEKPVRKPGPAARQMASSTKVDLLEDKPPVLRRAPPRLTDNLETDGVQYLQRRFGSWREEDARTAFGEPLRSRSALNARKEPDGLIYAYSDPSRKYREIELEFDRHSGLLRGAFLYPWGMKWDECRKLWGARVSTTQAGSGRRFHSYEDRRLDVLVDSAGNVISLGLY